VQSSRDSSMGVRDIAPVFVVLWFVNLVIVMLAVLHHDRFGPGLTVLSATVLILPVLLFGAIRQRSQPRS